MVRGGAHVPAMKRPSSDTERLLLAFARAGDIAVGGDRHRKIGSGHIASIWLRLRWLRLSRPKRPDKFIATGCGRSLSDNTAEAAFGESRYVTCANAHTASHRNAFAPQQNWGAKGLSCVRR